MDWCSSIKVTQVEQLFLSLWRLQNNKIKGVSVCSLKWLAMNASLLRKSGSIQERKREVCARDSGRGGTMEWKVRERYWGRLVRHLGGDDSVMMGEEASDGWDREREWGGNRKREGGWLGVGGVWGRAIVLFLTPPQKTPWQAVNQTGSLDWFSPLFNQHFTLRPSLPSECALMPTLCFFSSFFFLKRPLCYTPGPNDDCCVGSPEAAT